MIDVELVKRKMTGVRPYISRLDEICKPDLTAFLRDFDMRRLTERLLEIVAQAIIDI